MESISKITLLVKEKILSYSVSLITNRIVASILSPSSIFYTLFCSIFCAIIVYFIVRYCNKKTEDFVRNKLESDMEMKLNKDNNKDPFILSFRKTRTEALIILKIEEIQKDRYIQFVVSSLYYNDNKSINGCVYVVTSKVLYKLFFIKNSLICKEIHKFSGFVYSYNKTVYNKISKYLNDNESLSKDRHHSEFYTWPHYYVSKNYKSEMSKTENFLRTL